MPEGESRIEHGVETRRSFHPALRSARFSMVRKRSVRLALLGWGTQPERPMIFRNPWFQWAVFAVAFTIFYSLAYSAVWGIRDNYRRYAQKADLQWTGSRPRQKPRPPMIWILAAAAATAGIIVWGVIQ